MLLPSKGGKNVLLCFAHAPGALITTLLHSATSGQNPRREVTTLLFISSDVYIWGIVMSSLDIKKEMIHSVLENSFTTTQSYSDCIT